MTAPALAPFDSFASPSSGVMSDLHEQVWAAVVPVNDTGCLRHPSATGKVRLGLGVFTVAPVVWERFNGPLPVGHIVRRTCTTHLCCAPGHLMAGTRADLARWQGIGSHWRPRLDAGVH